MVGTLLAKELNACQTGRLPLRQAGRSVGSASALCRKDLRRPTAPCGSAHARDRPQGFFMQKRILLVSDDSAVRRMLFRLLAGEAHHVILPELDRASLRAALERQLDVMIVDVDPHNADVLQALSHAAQQHALPPAILLNSGLADSFFSHFQIASVLEKPLDLQELLTSVSVVGTAGPSVTA